MVLKDKFKYKCGYCGKEFNQDIGTRQKVSDQVRCPKCGNFIKNDSGRMIKDVKGQERDMFSS